MPKLVITFLCFYIIQPLTVFALNENRIQGSNLVTREIRYHAPEAGEVFLAWGINGWNVISEEARPAATSIKKAHMHTPMIRENDTFVIKVKVPSSATLDYGFLITKKRNGTAIESIWDGDHHASPSKGGLIEVTSILKSMVTQKIRYYMPDAEEVFLVWGINDWQTLPKETRPAKTEIKDEVMHTPMLREGEVFVTTVNVPHGTNINYGFLITKKQGGEAVSLWDPIAEKGYHALATQDDVIERTSRLMISQPKKSPNTLKMSLILLIAACIVCGIYAICRFYSYRSLGV